MNDRRLPRAAASLRAACLIAAAAFACGAAAQSDPRAAADHDAGSGARLPHLQRKDLDEPSQKIFDMLPGRSPTGELGGPLAFAAYNPEVAHALLDLHNAAVGKSTLTPHVRELAIMVACRETDYDLEWNGHEAAALKAGVDRKVLDVVRDNRPLTGLDESDAAVIRFGRELLHDRKMSATTFAKVKQLYGPRGAMDMVAVMATYAVSGLYAIAVDEQPEPGKTALAHAE